MFELIKNHRELNYIDKLFNELSGDSFLSNTVNNRFSDLHLSSDKDMYCIELALPGLEKKDISLSISNNYLYLNYESNNELNKPCWKNSFNRRIKLPRDIKSNSSEAELKNGILSVKIQKDSSGNSHKIKIK